MFINCPHCRALIATDPATDLPPPRCPRCAAQLDASRPSPAHASPGSDAVESARSGVAAAIEDAFGTPRDDDPESLAQPAVSVAALLRTVADIADDPAAQVVRDAEATGPAPTSEAAVEDAGADIVEAPPSRAAPQGDPDSERQPEAKPAPAPDDAATPAAARDTSAPTRRSGKPAPSFARVRRIATDVPSGRRWVMPAAIVGLGLLLGLQWLLADRARLAADPAWRPIVARTCAVLRCALPPWREPAAFALLERDVRPHPQRADTLRITASFRNNAAWPQPWPEVVLTLSDVDGRPLGTRAFTAADYLGQAPDSALIESGAGAVLRMDVREPGQGAVAFTFDFR